jgi:hypothetical protein
LSSGVEQAERLLKSHTLAVNIYQKQSIERMLRSKVPALVAERDRLVAWLEVADQRIATEDVPAEKRERREDDWIAKLREYESVMDTLSALAPVAFAEQAA